MGGLIRGETRKRKGCEKAPSKEEQDEGIALSLNLCIESRKVEFSVLLI